MTALAFSLDGRTFEFEADPSVMLRVGDLVELALRDGPALTGQVRRRTATAGDGVVLDGASTPFTDALVSRATAAAVRKVIGETDLVIGSFSTGGDTLPASLDGHRFNRHTFVCGQSGSGKTYSLGVLLERLAVATELPVVILDPNGDFVGLGRVRDDAADASVADGLRALAPEIRVYRPHDDRHGLHVRFPELLPTAQAATLRIDPISDREEYGAFLRALSDGSKIDAGTLLERLVSAGGAGAHLARRIENLGLLEWDVWALDRSAMFDEPWPAARVSVLDVSELENEEERQVIALAVLDHLWAHREARQPVLIVIDEAHHFASADPATPLRRLVSDRLCDIAAEGRKYGLWLLLSTQRPSKVHPNVLSQCDNLMLMRVNSPGDLAQLEDVFGFAPPPMLRLSPHFRQGEALIAGTFTPVPMVVTIGARCTEEGGTDVGVPRATGG